MDLKLLITVFGVIFLAELGDKTQLATLLFAADKEAHKLTIFFGASLALILASGIGVLAGGLVSQYVREEYLRWAAGIGFMAIGVWTLLRA
ncbi:MAG: TMEM165/GDT1 family protein [Gammaproteobacteria bacterium]|nr:TMEM165/GDT1 family protein [Gammaproteobacteria bacterium]